MLITIQFNPIMQRGSIVELLDADLEINLPSPPSRPAVISVKLLVCILLLIWFGFSLYFLQGTAPTGERNAQLDNETLALEEALMNRWNATLEETLRNRWNATTSAANGQQGFGCVGKIAFVFFFFVVLACVIIYYPTSYINV